MRRALLLLIPVVFLTGCSTLFSPIGEPPAKPTLEEADTDKDGVLSEAEAEAAKSEWERLFEEWRASAEVTVNPSVASTLETAGAIGSIFNPMVGMGTSLATAILGIGAWIQNRRRQKDAKVGAVMVDSMNHALDVIEGTELGAKGVEELKKWLRSQQISADVYDRIREILKSQA